MDVHSQFLARQTAAHYVANALDADTAEAFEMHLMECRHCVGDVELWRTVRRMFPKHASVPRVARWKLSLAREWRMAAALVIALGAGAAAGWTGHALQGPSEDSRTVFFNLPAVTRGPDECTALYLAPESETVVLRVAGLSRDHGVVLVDSMRHEIAAQRYSSWLQPDGSHLLRLPASFFAGQSLGLVSRAADGFDEPLGCLTGSRRAR
jgi:hypothetical protein